MKGWCLQKHFQDLKLEAIKNLTESKYEDISKIVNEICQKLN